MAEGLNQNMLLQLFLESLEANAAQRKNILQLKKNGQLEYDLAVKTIAQNFKNRFKPKTESAGLIFFETIQYYHEYVSKAQSQQEIANLVENAKVDYRAFRSLELFEFLIREYGKYFPALIEWQKDRISGIFEPPRRPTGSSEFKNLRRDTLIVGQIKILVDIGYLPTRNKGKSGQSACDVVLDALSSINQNLSYSTIEGIWLRREKLRSPKILIDVLLQSIQAQP